MRGYELYILLLANHVAPGNHDLLHFFAFEGNKSEEEKQS